MTLDQQRNLCIVAKSDNVRESNAATRKLLTLMQPIIYAVSRYFYGIDCVDLEDLRAAGRLGLMRAIRNYDPEFAKTQFKTYCYFYIFVEIYNHINYSNPLYLQHNQRSIRSKMFKDLKIGMKEVSEIMGTQVCEFDETLNEGVCDPVDDMVTKEMVENVISDLPAKNAMIVRKIFGLDTGVPINRTDIAASLGVSATEILAIEKHSLKLMRNSKKLCR